MDSTTLVRETIIQAWESDAEHARQHLHGGQWHCGMAACAPSRRPDPASEVLADEAPESSQAFYTLELLAALTLVRELPLAEREQLVADARAEHSRRQKEAGKAFARQVHQDLVGMGFSDRRASCIMRAAGPSRAIAAVEWARVSARKLRNLDALDCVLKGARGSTGFGWHRMFEALKALGLEPPAARSSGAFFATLEGAREALQSPVDGWLN